MRMFVYFAFAYCRHEMAGESRFCRTSVRGCHWTKLILETSPFSSFPYERRRPHVEDAFYNPNNKTLLREICTALSVLASAGWTWTWISSARERRGRYECAQLAHIHHHQRKEACGSFGSARAQCTLVTCCTHLSVGRRDVPFYW